MAKAKISENVEIQALIEKEKVINTVKANKITIMRTQIPSINKKEGVEDKVILSATIVTSLDIKLQSAGTSKENTRRVDILNVTHKSGHKIAECWHKQRDERKNEAGLIHQSNCKETLLIASHGSNIDEVWYLDSGAIKHMTVNKNLFCDLSRVDHGEVMIGDASTYKIEAVGEISFKTKSGVIEKMSEV